MKKQKITILYFAILKEESGVSQEIIKTTAQTAEALYQEVTAKYSFSLTQNMVKVAINNTFSKWDSAIHDNDTVAFIPPVSGGV